MGYICLRILKTSYNSPWSVETRTTAIEKKKGSSQYYPRILQNQINRRMKLNYFIKLMVIVLCFYGCKSKENRYELFIKGFDKNKITYDSIVKYITRTYIDTSDRANLSRKIILKCEGKERFGLSDDRICDSNLESFMNNLGVDVIYIEKNICFADRNFDLISFELSDNWKNETIYYRYSLCINEKNSSFESSSVTVIPLKKQWTLFIEN